MRLSCACNRKVSLDNLIPKNRFTLQEKRYFQKEMEAVNSRIDELAATHSQSYRFAPSASPANSLS